MRQQLGADGEQVAACQRHDLRGIAKARTHDFGTDAVLLEVVVNLTHRLHAVVISAAVRGFIPVVARLFFVPVVNAADKRRNQLHASLPAGHSLTERKQQGQIGVDAALL